MGNEIQVGIVSSVDAAAGSARVAFPNRGNTVSKELPVMKNAWPVKPQDLVVCIFPATGTDGFVLGSYHTIDDPPLRGE